jgi:uncharacterized protein (TIGR03086 family)
MEQHTDPRPVYEAAQDWAGDLLGAVRPGQWEVPTPCPEFTVRELAGHLLAVLDRARVVAEGGDVNAQPQVIRDVSGDDFATAFRARLPGLRAAWTDSALAGEVTVPPGIVVPGATGVWKYANEILVHGWDLAVATGQQVEAPPAVAQPVLDRADGIISAERRGGFIPFDPPVEPGPEAGPTEQLANWNGHRR